MEEILKFQKPEELEFLRKRSVEALVDLCKLAFDYIKNGSNVEKYEIFASNTGQTSEFIQKIVEILLEFLIDAVKFNYNDSHFQSLATDAGLYDDQISVLSQFVASKKETIENLLKQNQNLELRYRHLDWRLEARIASRTLHSQAVPLITMKLHLDSETYPDKLQVLSDTDTENTTKREVILQTDPNSLVHIIDQLEQALQESKSHRTRNFIKAFKQ
ncbi:COMM domain-containing protein 2 [Culicoides brevitarsis]|uniref:COMM domain-containing protein 2 n=1 Tax=Culicoides brevitarsis TaxID=469753 RepID=UPI00307BA24F